MQQAPSCCSVPYRFPLKKIRLLSHSEENPRIVITGIGMLASVGATREAVWQSVRAGRSKMSWLTGMPEIPDGLMIGAPCDLPHLQPGKLKVIELCERAAEEAMTDAGLLPGTYNGDRFGCAISAHMGDCEYLLERNGCREWIIPGKPPWIEQWLPNTSCIRIANRYGLFGPRFSHSTACASGLIDFISAVRAIQDDQCDLALAGSGEAISPLFAAGFHRMKVLATHDDPKQACRPFDVDRCGFVMGEGSAMFVVERLSHALQRGATIYAEVLAHTARADAHHVTGLEQGSESLAHVIDTTLKKANLTPRDISYINAHGTGTQLNDVTEARAIRRVMGLDADRIGVSSVKSVLGHLINAAGSVELAITMLALRDGFSPPTMNLHRPDPACDLDCLPMIGREEQFEHALKLSVAFGGHLAAVALRRWNDAATGFAYPSLTRAA
jgi:3-oxoacyl-(acyl-carrier-protein) synthase